MKLLIAIISMTTLMVSCKKEPVEMPAAFSEARYTITITGKWTSPAFTVPPGAHYTTFIGMVHNGNAGLWKEGTKASYGTEVLAETGQGAPILAEIDSTINTGNGLALILFVSPTTIGSSNVSIYCNSNYSKISLESMLGPTPDWFVGVSGMELYNNKQWVADTTINLYAYDAGTEEGDVFGYANPATVPQQDIHLLQAGQATVLANGNTSLAPIATARFRRQ